MIPRDCSATEDSHARFEQLENSSYRTIVVKGFPESATVYEIMECLGVSHKDLQKTERDNRPEHHFETDRRTKEKKCVFTLRRAALADSCMQNNRNTTMDGCQLQLTLKDTKTILIVDHQSVRISRLPPDITVREIVDLFTRDVGGILFRKNGDPEIQFLFRFKKQTIVKLTFDSVELAENCAERHNQLFSVLFPKILKIRLFEIRERTKSSKRSTNTSTNTKSAVDSKSTPSTNQTMSNTPSNKAKPKSSANKKPKAPKSGRKKYTVVPNVVYVRGFPKHFTEAELFDIATTCGKVVRVVIYRDDKKVSKGAGTVSFADASEAKVCIARFNGAKFDGTGHILQINEFRSRVEYNDEENASKPGQRYECIICYDTFDGRDVLNCVPVMRGYGNRETHFTCKDCVSGHAKALCSEGVVAQGGTGIPCGFPGCKRAILRAHLMRLLDDDTSRQLEKLLDTVALSSIKGMERCKSCDFGGILPSKFKMQFFVCENPSCGAQFCRFCKIDYAVHFGKRCCDVEPGRRKEMERKKFEEALSNAVIRKCRKCRLSYQKIEGCNMMTCSTCKTTQCYLCRQSDIDYDHFIGGKCEQFSADYDPDQRNLDEVRRNARSNRWLDGVRL